MTTHKSAVLWTAGTLLVVLVAPQATADDRVRRDDIIRSLDGCGEPDEANASAQRVRLRVPCLPGHDALRIVDVRTFTTDGTLASASRTIRASCSDSREIDVTVPRGGYATASARVDASAPATWEITFGARAELEIDDDDREIEDGERRKRIDRDFDVAPEGPRSSWGEPPHPRAREAFVRTAFDRAKSDGASLARIECKGSVCRAEIAARGRVERGTILRLARLLTRSDASVSLEYVRASEHRSDRRNGVLFVRFD